MPAVTRSHAHERATARGRRARVGAARGQLFAAMKSAISIATVDGSKKLPFVTRNVADLGALPSGITNKLPTW